MRFVLRSLSVLGCAFLVAGTTAAQQESSPPTPEAAVKRACDAVGGLEAFKKLGIVVVATKSEEVTQAGKINTTIRTNYFLAPGPLPGRFEYPDRNIVAADDGTGGWAVVQQKPDTRPTTSYMVQRLLTTPLFPILLPFSLTWRGVAVQDVKAAELKGRSVWQLSVEVPRNFFDTPQISPSWTVFLDRTTFAVLQAESPFTDLGKGVTADGMRFTWQNPVKVGSVTFYREQRVTGLDELGQEKTHSRTDRLQYRTIPASEATKFFANPIPPEQRPKPQAPPMPRPRQPQF